MTLCADNQPTFDATIDLGAGQDYRRAVTKARAICGRCPTYADCLTWVMTDARDQPGVVAGLTLDERTRNLIRTAA